MNFPVFLFNRMPSINRYGQKSGKTFSIEIEYTVEKMRININDLPEAIKLLKELRLVVSTCT